MKRYYFDLDGVTMLYKRELYLERKDGPPLYLRKNGHVFRDLEPDPWALYFIHSLIGYTRTHPSLDNRNEHDEVYILTSIAPGPMFNEHFHDKLVRTLELIPQLSIDNMLISVGNKCDCVEFILDHQLTQDDILFDDWNINLRSWRDAGGIAIKYINNFNDPRSFDGLCIGPAYGTVEETLQRMILI